MSKSRKTYIVNPQKKVVVTLMNANTEFGDVLGVADEVIRKCTCPTTYAVLDMMESAKNLKLPDLDIPIDAVFKGVSKCDDHDEFDKETGIMIADNKAEMKYHIAMAKKYKRLTKLFEKAFEEMYVLECEHANKALKLKERNDKFLKTPNEGFEF